MTISCQETQKKRELARVLADEEGKTFSGRKGGEEWVSATHRVWQRAFGLERA